MLKILKKEENEDANNTSNDNAVVPILLPEDTEKKKPVFAKFKSYNKDTSNKVVTKDKDTSSSASNVTKNATKNATELANATTIRNRYTCHGKIGNMAFLKKIDRTIVDKNYKMSFSDFKRLKPNSCLNIV